jgi:predicted dehydrogenase
MGTQGSKRRQSIGVDMVGFVDPFHKDSDYNSICEVPKESYDAAMVCTPDKEKCSIIQFLLENGKHVLCEKPLLFKNYKQYQKLQTQASISSAVYYTAYNHRFEPSLILAKDIINGGNLGEIYFVNLFYGNGTSQDILSSSWRDTSSGVILDLGSHLLDLLNFWFSKLTIEFQLTLLSEFETKSPDYAILHSWRYLPRITLEMTACMWKNTFRADIVGSKGSLHIEGLAKWGRSILSQRTRVYPSGIPEESITTFEAGDLTWEREYQHFKNLITTGYRSSLNHDYYIWDTLEKALKQSKKTL